MSERPILFSGAMVRAILSGQKTQTRRVVRPQPLHGVGRYTEDGTPGEVDWVILDEDGDPTDSALRCPYGAPGDALWVRETWAVGRAFDRTRPSEIPTVERDIPVWWRADEAIEESVNRGRWRPSLHMPRWASRITLDIVSVRVERLQTITTLDAMAEGAEPVRNAAGVLSYTTGFRTLWDSINGARPGCSWDDDPWVWVVEFRGTT